MADSVASMEFQPIPSERPLLSIEYTVTAIPILPASWLFGPGLLALLGIAVRRSWITSI